MALSIEELKHIACGAIDQAAEELHQVALEIWNNPEENFQEFHAHQILTDSLESHNFQVKKKYTLDTAFRASHTNGSGPNIAVLCEYDALPEIGHACGHNLIAEVGLGAGIGVKAALVAAKEKKMELGTVTVLGTPAEEGGGGKIDMINKSVFSDIDVAMMCHPFAFSSYEADQSFLAIQQVEVTYKGKASHASAFPWQGLNALDAAVMAYNNISVFRQQMKPNWKVHGIITNGGTKPNIIPEETQLCYYLRASNRAELKCLKEKAIQCFEAAAIATGCKVEFKWAEKAYDNMISNPTVLTTFMKNTKTFDVKYLTSEESGVSKITGSTDMGNVSYVVPSIHPMFHIGGNKNIHTRDFAELTGSKNAQPHALIQAKVLAMTALDLMMDKTLLDQAKQEFKEIPTE